jgi:hypothetical protein
MWLKRHVTWQRMKPLWKLFPSSNGRKMPGYEAQSTHWLVLDHTLFTWEWLQIDELQLHAHIMRQKFFSKIVSMPFEGRSRALIILGESYKIGGERGLVAEPFLSALSRTGQDRFPCHPALQCWHSAGSDSAHLVLFPLRMPPPALLSSSHNVQHSELIDAHRRSGGHH